MDDLLTVISGHPGKNGSARNVLKDAGQEAAFLSVFQGGGDMRPAADGMPAPLASVPSVATGPGAKLSLMGFAPEAIGNGSDGVVVGAEPDAAHAAKIEAVDPFPSDGVAGPLVPLATGADALVVTGSERAAQLVQEQAKARTTAVPLKVPDPVAGASQADRSNTAGSEAKPLTLNVGDVGPTRVQGTGDMALSVDVPARSPNPTPAQGAVGEAEKTLRAKAEIVVAAPTVGLAPLPNDTPMRVKADAASPAAMGFPSSPALSQTDARGGMPVSPKPERPFGASLSPIALDRSGHAPDPAPLPSAAHASLATPSPELPHAPSKTWAIPVNQLQVTPAPLPSNNLAPEAGLLSTDPSGPLPRTVWPEAAGLRAGATPQAGGAPGLLSQPSEAGLRNSGPFGPLAATAQFDRALPLPGAGSHAVGVIGVSTQSGDIGPPSLGLSRVSAASEPTVPIAPMAAALAPVKPSAMGARASAQGLSHETRAMPAAGPIHPTGLDGALSSSVAASPASAAPLPLPMPVSAALHPAQKAFAFSLPVPGSEPIEVLLGAANMPSAAGPGDGLDRPIPPELPQSAARQIAVAVAGLPRETGAGVDIALDPPELGRVRLSLVEINGTLTLSIIAERPETVDLMRRHLVLLADEFARQGLDAPMVDISGERQGRQGAQGASPPPSADRMTDAPAPPVPTAPPITRSAKADGLDLRL